MTDETQEPEQIALTPEEMEALNEPATKAEVLVAVSQLAEDVQSVVNQFNNYIEQILVNQEEMVKRLEALEDPAKPRIYLP